jgi:hypothetical protein
VAEKNGIASVTIAGPDFVGSAKATGEGGGISDLPIAVYPGAFDTHTPETLRKNTEEVLYEQIVEALTQAKAAESALTTRPGPRDIVFTGTYEEVNAFFYDNLWSDGLPIVPPTVEKIEEFLKYTGYSPDDVLGVLAPALREASVWSVAVNGVMAGCRPEYMPVLIAVVETIADPNFRVENVGSTGGWESVVILNGPIIRQLDFNYDVGVMRPGRQANTTVGRFLRLYLRNVAGFLPGSGDMATFGVNFYNVLAENEVTSPWEPLSVHQGFKAGANVVTVNSIHSMSRHTSTGTAEPTELLEVITRMLIGELTSNRVDRGEIHPMVVMTPVLADLLADAGYSKESLSEYFFEHVRITAAAFEKESGSACELVEEGKLEKELFCPSEDPNRMVPLLHSPDELFIIVSGTQGRDRVFVTSQGGDRGLGTSKEIKLPAGWDKLMAELEK